MREAQNITVCSLETHLVLFLRHVATADPRGLHDVLLSDCFQLVVAKRKINIISLKLSQ